MKHRPALLSSSVAFLLALLLTITWHELGHALAAVALGLRPTLYPFSVDTRAVSDAQQVTTALAGPVLSLVTGAVLLAVHARLSRTGFWPLTLLWLGLAGVQTFAGYLITGVFVRSGDIGKALDLTGAPLWVGVVVFALGWGLTYLNGRHATRQLLRLTDPARKLAPQLRDLGLFAWLLATVVAFLISFGTYDVGSAGVAIAVFEVLGTLSTGIFLIFVRLFMGETPARRAAPAWPVPWPGIAAVVVVALVRQLVLARGVTF